MTEVKFIQKGPCIIHCDEGFEDLDEAGKLEKTLEGSIVTLKVVCMCGKSKNHPYCDGSHKNAEK